ncbi:MAG: flavodoxin family protein, partial [Gammaproteobacteria bacterium]
AHAILGAKLYGATVDVISITNIFAHSKMDIYYDLLQYETIDDIDEIDSLTIDDEKFKDLLEKVYSADGVVLSTPVYFGDRSSIANKFLQLTHKYKGLKNKAFGVVSVGAKRNGGQETANIYALQEALAQGAIVVGNGPKTSQYGGTVWAGDPGKALQDDFGLETCYGTGRQVAQLAEIILLGDSTNIDSLKISYVLTMDTFDKEYETLLNDHIQTTLGQLKNQNLEINVYNLINNTIYRCIACTVCPSPKMVDKLKNIDFPYHCVVQTKKDDMKYVQEALVHSDCIILVGVNSQKELQYRYQAFMERTRFIRHDDYELTNIPTIGMTINELGATNNPIFNVKVLTSFIRHNTFFLKPIDLVLHNGIKIYEDSLNEIIVLLKKIKDGRKKINPLEISYKATGYENKTLDHTAKLRR